MSSFQPAARIDGQEPTSQRGQSVKGHQLRHRYRRRQGRAGALCFERKGAAVAMVGRSADKIEETVTLHGTQEGG